MRRKGGRKEEQREVRERQILASKILEAREQGKSKAEQEKREEGRNPWIGIPRMLPWILDPKDVPWILDPEDTPWILDPKVQAATIQIIATTIWGGKRWRRKGKK
jgi:hypothetical protein